MGSNARTTLIVAGLIVVGFVVGLAAASGGDTATKTVTVANTETKTVVRATTSVRTHTEVRYRTVTEPAPVAADDSSDGSDCSSEYEGACVPDGYGDVDCGELVDSDFDSVGSDPYASMPTVTASPARATDAPRA